MKAKDFASKQEVRWCPGCGDYAILAALQRSLATLDVARENHVFVSGIGCAGRLPYYMNCFGFHTIHGRAPAVATGLKLTRPDLSVWVITGDGDGLSIGTNHLLHCIRRDLDINILLFNNQIYGLTKGQFSPTSPLGQKTKTSPQGVADKPLNPLSMALAAGASFVARGIDRDPKQLAELFQAAHAHKGTSFIEIYQNCNIFNDGAFERFTEKGQREKYTVSLQQGNVMRYGSDGENCLCWDGHRLIADDYSDTISTRFDRSDLQLAQNLLDLEKDRSPVSLGIIYQKDSPEPAVECAQVSTDECTDLSGLFSQGETWRVG